MQRPDRFLEALADTIGMQEPSTRKSREIHQSPESAVSFDVAGEFLHFAPAIPSSPDRADVGAHA